MGKSTRYYEKGQNAFPLEEILRMIELLKLAGPSE
jgi:hypothetical protein